METTINIKFYGKKIQTTPEQYGQYADYVDERFQIASDRDEAEVQSTKLGNEQVVEITFDEGETWFAQAGELPKLLAQDPGNPYRDIDENGVFQLPSSVTVSDGSRDLGRKIVKFFQWFKRGANDGFGEATAVELAGAFEKKILGDERNPKGEGLYLVDAEFNLVRFEAQPDKIDPKKPVLLMLHGTASHTTGSFGGFKESKSEWSQICAIYQTNILALEHRSLTKSPFENLVTLLDKLPVGLELHLMSQSRGGLVGELLYCISRPKFSKQQAMEYLKKRDRKDQLPFLELVARLVQEKKPKITKFVRVACPAAGTSLLSERIDHVLNAIFILLRKLSPAGPLTPVLKVLQELVIATANERTDIKVLPGLEAMHPNSSITGLFTILRDESNAVVEHDLYVVQGATGLNWNLGRLILWLAARYVFWGKKNDFVIDSSSMTQGVVRPGSVYCLPQGGEVHHLSYFKALSVQTGIRNALKAKERELPSGFQNLSPDAIAMRSRGGLSNLPIGNLYPKAATGNKPVVVLLPGIMGSNLYEEGDEVWINLFRTAFGGLKRLDIDNHVTADSVIDEAYGKFCKFLEQKGYDVVVVPYDWRLDLKTLGNRLKLKLQEILEKTNDIQIVAHSMGGLLVKDLMVRHGEFWQQLKNNSPQFRAILLGTPWRGSYLLPMVFTGRGATINALQKLDLVHSVKELLEIFVLFPGLYDLLPHSGHEFYEPSLWKEVLQKTTDSSNWALPSDGLLNQAKDYAANTNPEDLTGIIYVAGKKNNTPAYFSLEDKYGRRIASTETKVLKEAVAANPKLRLVFEGTEHGDGSVTWASGIPFDRKDITANLYYVDTEHAELANDNKNFEGLLELLKKGTTSRLSTKAPKTRAGEDERRDLPTYEYIPNSFEGLVRAALGFSTEPSFVGRTDETTVQLAVSLVNGHLKHAKYPLMVGHLRGNGILSAESVLNFYMDNALVERETLGVYPGEVGTSIVLPPCNDLGISAIIIGMGEQQSLTPFRLSKAVERGCIDYMLSLCNHKGNHGIGISSILIGTGYANLSLNTAMTAIINGITNANQHVRRIGERYPQIGRLELIELYKDKAETAYFQLHQLEKNMPISLEGFSQMSGARDMIDLDQEREWWTRITALEKKDVSGQSGTYVSASNGRARVDERFVFINREILEALLEESNLSPEWDPVIAKSLFELLVPNDFKIAFLNQQNILWILDDKTARYPIEMLHYDENATQPVGVNAGMIRQLAYDSAAPVVNLVTNKRAVVIGDPKLADDRASAQLPAAMEEAMLVSDLLKRNNFETILLINSTFSEIFRHLSTEYRILHVASHGVVNYLPKKDPNAVVDVCKKEVVREQTGILLSHKGKDLILTPDVIGAFSSVPELVFINCCHLGKVDWVKERYFAERYELAANIGTAFIKKGARAVVVAGWAVNDEAAKLFAEIFYDNMLGDNNQTFGEAVRAARKACFDKFPNTNTWGAYQCYGDPFFKLQRNGSSNKENEEIILEKQALIKLESWLNKVNSYNDLTAYNPKRDQLKDELNSIISQIEKSEFKQTGAVLEMEAFCFAEIGMLLEAVGKFKELFDTEGAIHTSKAVLEYKRLVAILEEKELALAVHKHVPSGPEDPKANEIDLTSLPGINDYLTYLDGIKEPSYKLCMRRAEAKARLAVVTGKQKYLADASKAFREAYDAKNEREASQKLPAFVGWVSTLLLSSKDDEEVTKNFKSLEKTNSLKRLEAEWDAVKDDSRRNNWLVLRNRILLAENRLLLKFNVRNNDNNAAERESLVSMIKRDYKNWLRLSGSPLTRMERLAIADCYKKFIALENLKKLSDCKNEIEELHKFYTEQL